MSRENVALGAYRATSEAPGLKPSLTFALTFSACLTIPRSVSSVSIANMEKNCVARPCTYSVLPSVDINLAQRTHQLLKCRLQRRSSSLATQAPRLRTFELHPTITVSRDIPQHRASITMKGVIAPLPCETHSVDWCD